MLILFFSKSRALSISIFLDNIYSIKSFLYISIKYLILLSYSLFFSFKISYFEVSVIKFLIFEIVASLFPNIVEKLFIVVKTPPFFNADFIFLLISSSSYTPYSPFFKNSYIILFSSIEYEDILSFILNELSSYVYVYLLVYNSKSKLISFFIGDDVSNICFSKRYVFVTVVFAGNC